MIYNLRQTGVLYNAFVVVVVAAAAAAGVAAAAAVAKVKSSINT